MAKVGATAEPKAKKTKQKEQSERFRRTARELGCDESEGALERAFEKIVLPRYPAKASAKPPKMR